jgi:hypothetical protein
MVGPRKFLPLKQKWFASREYDILLWRLCGLRLRCSYRRNFRYDLWLSYRGGLQYHF